MRTALHFSLASELLALGAAVVTGILLAILYRVFSFLRRYFSAGRLLTLFFDLFYVFFFLVILFFYGFAFLGGDVRLYALAACAAGFLIWRQAEKIIFHFLQKTSSIFRINRV